ncbi:hypothetical protein [Streptomyces sp. PT12]|uniref:hypothetical protein n=1 Tax=Streptomyces sp. PT12 TaxID=1510197 RepID=UPI000DE22248|nr:hypothetical protein [Streptomyces sp. PT12]RBM11780.1 hypothetical protein DEH69_21050 [Streptomyces sp. PT12]
MAAVIGPALLLGLFAAPPARAADGQLAEAAQALAEGPGVWVAEGYEGIDDDAVALMNARYGMARTPVRVAMLTEEIPEGDAAAEELAAEVGQPGVYLVYNEVHTPVSDSPDTSEAWAVSGVSATLDELAAENMERIGIPSGNFLLTLPDALDGDLRPRVAQTAGGDDPFFVDPAVSEAFPGLDEEMLREAFADVPSVRVALVSGLGGDMEEARASMLDGLPDDGVALLMQWEDGEFSAVVSAGSGVPFSISELEMVVGASGITEVPAGELPERVALLASVLGEDVTEVAREALAAGPSVYVHPGVSDGHTDADTVAALADDLAAADGAARVAFLPEGVTELQTGDDYPMYEPDAARLIAADGGNAAVFLVDPYHGGRISTVSATGDEAFVWAAEFAWNGEENFVASTMTSLLEELGASAISGGGGDADAGGGGEDEAAGSEAAEEREGAGLRRSVLIVLAVVAIWVLPPLVMRLTRRQRRTLAMDRHRRRLARLAPDEARAELARAKLAAQAARADLIRLGDELADAREPSAPRALRILQRLRAEYERLLHAQANVLSATQVPGIRKDTARVRKALRALR